MSGSYDYVTTTGVIVPDIGTIKDQVDSEWTGQFGTGLNTDSSTPQGVIIASDVAAREGVVNNNAAVANQINPSQAEGVFLDAICALTGLERLANTFSQVTLTLAGVAGSPIAAGSQATSANADVFALDADVTLSGGGTATGVFTALVSGPIPAPSGTYTPSAVLGWDTAVAADVGTVGTAQQSDEALRTLRAQTLFLQGAALMGATLSALNNLTGVKSVQGLENVIASTQTIDTIALTANSIWVCVDGGDPTAIANSLLANKSMGSNWNGSQTLAVIEPTSGQSYTVKWDDPTLVPLLVRVTCKQGTFVGNPTAIIPQAVVNFANGLVANLEGFSLGQSASPFEVATGVMAQCEGLYISKVELSLVSSVSYAPAEIAMAINQKATVIAANVAVVIS